jgi:hypothetical protein
MFVQMNTLSDVCSDRIAHLRSLNITTSDAFFGIKLKQIAFVLVLVLKKQKRLDLF